MTQPPNEEQIVFHIGGTLWFDSGAILLLQDDDFDMNHFLRRHATGDPGSAAETLEEIEFHMTQCANESGDIVSAFPIPGSNRHICFTTKQSENSTYIYVR